MNHVQERKVWGWTSHWACSVQGSRRAGLPSLPSESLWKGWIRSAPSCLLTVLGADSSSVTGLLTMRQKFAFTAVGAAGRGTGGGAFLTTGGGRNEVTWLLPSMLSLWKLVASISRAKEISPNCWEINNVSGLYYPQSTIQGYDWKSWILSRDKTWPVSPNHLHLVHGGNGGWKEPLVRRKGPKGTSSAWNKGAIPLIASL